MCSIDCSRKCRVASARPVMPDLYMPAMPPLGLIARVRRLIDRRACRRELESLLAEDDRRLTDLGLARHRIRYALRHAGAENPCRLLSEPAVSAETSVGRDAS